jgi:hypothetical protein
MILLVLIIHQKKNIFWDILMKQIALTIENIRMITFLKKTVLSNTFSAKNLINAVVIENGFIMTTEI